MKYLVLVAAMLGLSANAQAHVAEMPAVVHLAEHGWQLMALIAVVAVLTPLFRMRR